MFYFINEYLLAKNSSVEHAAIDRVRLFNQFHQPAKIVTKTYDRLLHGTVTAIKLPDEQILNMFDFFQQTTSVESRFVRTDDLKLPVEYAVTVGADFSEVTNGDNLVSKVGFIPGTIGRVYYQEFLDNQGNPLSTDLWDWRGFKSSTQYFGQNGKLIMQRYYNLAGQTVLEEYYVADVKGNPLLSRVILRNYQHQSERFFQNRDDLFNFFIAELSRLDSTTTTFISDRPGTGVQPLLRLNDDSHKYVNVPIYHAKDINEPLHSPLDGYLQPAFDNLTHFDGVITATNKQAQHLQRRFPNGHVMVMPNVTTTARSQAPLRPITERKNQLLYVGRLAPDRQLEQLIRVVALVKKDINNVRCDLYGYGDAKYVDQLKKLVADLQLEKQVRLCGYQPDLSGVYDNYQILLNTALANGGPMAMQEAMAHGLPVISYQFNYGPADFIDDGVTGYVIKPGDQLTMSKRILELQASPQKLTAFSEAAYAQLHDHQTATKVWHRWQRALGL
ncbi:accessory Sec system glycosyltransferase Asp1 [Lactiplantibacillus garii]|uniref:Accessory Sec system glycosyltransferase Asp1 n=1 Tax=Lactiplantibacillus garii TaxID=2306423 RepID=A0A426D619_9LACO|nr:accessory Sec system glycosyltransferase Asp1 [Lactiplantibacillus garii]RRK10054.1 accessory Sec system glycosyltransferase Asp1 [Lactiplantibacillus garii]